jgi:hypothetical protein
MPAISTITVLAVFIFAFVAGAGWALGNVFIAWVTRKRS